MRQRRAIAMLSSLLLLLGGPRRRLRRGPPFPRGMLAFSDSLKATTGLGPPAPVVIYDGGQRAGYLHGARQPDVPEVSRVAGARGAGEKDARAAACAAARAAARAAVRAAARVLTRSCSGRGNLRKLERGVHKKRLVLAQGAGPEQAPGGLQRDERRDCGVGQEGQVRC